MHICIYIYTHIHLYVHTSIYIYTRIFTFANTYTYVYIYIYRNLSNPHLQSIIPRQLQNKHITYVYIYIYIKLISKYLKYIKRISNHIKPARQHIIEEMGKHNLLRSLLLDSLGAPKRISRLNALHKSCKKRSEAASTQTPWTPSVPSGMEKTYNHS